MSEFKKLSRAEMRNVLGGTMPIGGDECSKDCVCPDGSHANAKITGCDKDSCKTDSTGASCKKGGTDTFANCVNYCPAT